MNQLSNTYQSYPIASHRPHERFEGFQAVVDTVFCPMQIEVERRARAGFESSMDSVDLGAIQMVRISTSPVAVQRRARDIARIPDPPYLIKFQMKGESLWRQRSREVHAHPGDFIICSTAEPYALTFKGLYEMVVMVVSRSTMRQLTPDPDQFLGMRMAGDDADCGLLSSFVGQVAARMNRLPEQMARRIEGNVLDLLGGVLGARACETTMTRSQQLARMKAFITEHLRNRRLTPGLVAHAFGVSTRHVHALFETDGISVGRYVRSLRVAGCRKSLEAAVEKQWSLTDIAHYWGFYDLSHMTRCFRQEFGSPPGRYLLRIREHE